MMRKYVLLLLLLGQSERKPQYLGDMEKKLCGITGTTYCFCGIWATQH